MMNETFTHTVVGGGNSSAIQSKFITEAALAEQRQERESEAKSHGKDLEEVYDPRPLFERLAEKKRIEEEEFAEKMKFSNMVKRLDDDEYEFLVAYDDEEEKKRKEIAAADEKELEQFRKAVTEGPIDPATIAAEALGTSKPSRPAQLPKQAPAKDFQRSILNGIVRKRKASDGPAASAKSADAGGSAETSPSKKRVAKEGSDGAGVKAGGKGGALTGSKPPALATSKSVPSAPASNSLSLLAAYSDDSDSDDN
ncbi:hypothetical protein HK097_000134 [Rhizophlyctis rosea]|uniref:FAM192A/Fyv6 N-terminal domain-containing protein n=1 Tax=Rhizophlyctis rosea TaxID=64517 RepID=A0AAD5SNR0_9FUNG|nr:hypothetical protein HK097_000134 [Rhizophlyctis rosea]